ncbi:dolichyl-diphosphooligosaccharide--protein glycosyltransferase subunit 2-like [Saccoglossus kowalevskii]|uniref:Dolichyl-diphosphooligosaccharide--protein glycosyltransferase subunit 2 n=1 Tax=Saccoglossus kowalevskii TaxID=10224 RepID=A0ABM0GSK8_SACKO|nr:PREDICTED: dolichyl-diphosphooligosaccharide--protein glycosyltransferase subunit 2-like [Saccoglossus kowalevskii]
MERGALLLFFLAFGVVGQALTPTTVLTAIDQARLKAVFENTQPFTDIASAHYSILGLKLLGGGVPKAPEACTFLKNKVDTKNVQSLFYATAATKALGTCQIAGGDAEQVLTTAINESADVATLYYAVSALSNMGLKFNSADVLKSLEAALKKDDSLLSSVYALHIASQLSAESDVSLYVDSVEDLLAQADEIDESYMQFEGGLSVTSLFIDGAYKLANRAKKPPTITEDKVVMLANYILSRKHTQSNKNGYYVVAALRTLSENQYHVPVAVTLVSSVAVSGADPNVKVKVTNLMQGSLGKLSVTANSATHMEDDAVILSKKPFTASSTDPSLYELNLMQTKPAPGFYTIEVNVTPSKEDKRLIGTEGSEVKVKVTTEVTVVNSEMAVMDRDQSIASKSVKVNYPGKVDRVVEADHHQLIVFKFALKDKATSKIMTAHQTFVQLVNVKTKQEIIFIAEADDNDVYRFELDVAESAKEHFNSLSGKYTMSMIIGDAVVQNPFVWVVADLQLKFPETADGDNKQEVVNQYAKKPEIQHEFNKPEKRPPLMLSNFFAALCVLPFLVLIILWIRIGANLKNFTFSLGTIGFHVGLGGIFGLYYCYFLYLDMFSTLKYLTLIGVVTFLAGNRMLGAIAKKRA